MTRRFSSLFVVFSSLVTALGCSAGAAGRATARGDGGGGNQPGSGGSGAGTGTDINTEPAGMPDPTDTRNAPSRPKVCDATGTNCTCLRLALLGTLESSADETNTQPFVDWLNTSSGGTAAVTIITTKPTIDKAFLAKYDILVVANVNSWAFTPDEQTAVADWVKTTAGGIISLTGFSSVASEPAATSQLISFSGISYGSTATASQPQAQAAPVYYKGGTANMKDCFQWQPAPTANKADITAPIKFTPQMDTLQKLTANLDYVGAFYGWDVVAPTDATVIGTDPVTNKPIAVAKEVMGMGRIFAWGDEWVIFKNQWEKSGTPSNKQMDAGNPCWVPANGTTAGFYQSVETLYQTKQFWYDAINWVAPPNQCFTITDTEVTTVK
ncbi:MAG: hypothetical protein ABJB12_15675 [Pseudomonadota bacterium]